MLQDMRPKKPWLSKAIMGALGTASMIIAAAQVVAAATDWTFLENGLQLEDLVPILLAVFYFIKEYGHRAAKRPISTGS